MLVVMGTGVLGRVSPCPASVSPWVLLLRCSFKLLLMFTIDENLAGDLGKVAVR